MKKIESIIYFIGIFLSINGITSESEIIVRKRERERDFIQQEGVKKARVWNARPSRDVLPSDDFLRKTLPIEIFEKVISLLNIKELCPLVRSSPQFCIQKPNNYQAVIVRQLETLLREENWCFSDKQERKVIKFLKGITENRLVENIINLALSNNLLSSEAFQKELDGVVSKVISLRVYAEKSLGLRSAEVSSKFLYRIPYLTILSLCGLTFSTEGAKNIVAFLEQRGILGLTLMDCVGCDDHLENKFPLNIFHKGLFLERVKVLNLSGTPIDPQSFQNLEHCVSLEKLKLVGYTLTDYMWLNNLKVHSLFLELCCFNQPVSQVFSSLLKLKQILRELYLEESCGTVISAELIDALSFYKSLTSLGIKRELSKDCFKEFYKFPQTLRTLELTVSKEEEIEELFSQSLLVQALFINWELGRKVSAKTLKLLVNPPKMFSLSTIEILLFTVPFWEEDIKCLRREKKKSLNLFFKAKGGGNLPEYYWV
jgi:hypothetical protein